MDNDSSEIYAHILDMTRVALTQNGSTYAGTGHAVNPICTSASCVITEATLSSGALNNHPLYAPGAGYTYFIWYVQIGSNMSAGAAQNMVLEFEDEDSGNVFSCNMLGRDVHRLDLNQTGPGDDKDFQCDIAGGSASEHIFFICQCAKHT
jgi:hypothetical protein